MPIPAAALAAIVSSGSQLLGTGISAASTAAMNRKTREWNEKMYAVQRKDALSDWAMQNEYNSPVEQMKRLRKAGLNPNLVYGNGVDGNASGQVRNTEMKSWNPEAPQYNLGAAANAGISAFYDVQVREAQIDNLTTQNTVLKNDAMLKAAQTIATYINANKSSADTKLKEFDLKQKESLFDTVLEQAVANLNLTRTKTSYTLDENERRTALTASSLAQAYERILTMRKGRAKTDAEIRMINQQIENLKKDERLKQLDIELKELGFQPGDELWQRVLARLIQAQGHTGDLLGQDNSAGGSMLIQGGRKALGSGLKKR